jgi:hypothetical protein
MKVLKKNFKFSPGAAIKNLLDLPRIYKRLNPDTKYSSLAHITFEILG